MRKANRQTYTIVIRTVEGGYVASCPAVPECHAQGATYAEALANAREALALCLEYMREQGLPLPTEAGTEQVAIPA